MQLKEQTSRANVLILAILCLYTLANIGCSAVSAPKSSTTSLPAEFSISGRISPGTTGTGVTVTLGGEATATTTTDRAGNYSFTGLSAGSYSVTPNKAAFNFSPSTREITLDASLTSTNFTISANVRQSGPIVLNGQNGTVIEGLKITSSQGDCVTITNSTNITIENTEIGPCGGNAVRISGGSKIKIVDSYIHPETPSPGCCDHNDGIFANGGTQSLWIQGNVIAYGEANIEVQGASTVTVIGNFLLNPRGPYPRGQNFQCWNNCSNVTVQNNYALSSQDTSQYLYPEATQDSINLGITNSFIVRSNFITGGHSASGCGIMADTFTNNGQILNNLLLNTGQCGIGIVDGTHTANSNRINNRNDPPEGLGNTAMYVAHYGKSKTCGPIIVTNNFADELRRDGTHSGWWNGQDCGPIDITTDTFGASADEQFSSPSVTFAPPLIPPQPTNCVVNSPYSTQTSPAPCQE